MRLSNLNQLCRVPCSPYLANLQPATSNLQPPTCNLVQFMSPATFTTAESVGAAGATWGKKIKDMTKDMTKSGAAAREALHNGRRPVPAKV